MTMFDYFWLCLNMYDYVWLCMWGRERERKREREREQEQFYKLFYPFAKNFKQFKLFHMIQMFLKIFCTLRAQFQYFNSLSERERERERERVYFSDMIYSNSLLTCIFSVSLVKFNMKSPSVGIKFVQLSLHSWNSRVS